MPPKINSAANSITTLILDKIRQSIRIALGATHSIDSEHESSSYQFQSKVIAAQNRTSALDQAIALILDGKENGFLTETYLKEIKEYIEKYAKDYQSAGFTEQEAEVTINELYLALGMTRQAPATKKNKQR